jgi:hypothetical protein
MGRSHGWRVVECVYQLGEKVVLITRDCNGQLYQKGLQDPIMLQYTQVNGSLVRAICNTHAVIVYGATHHFQLIGCWVL